MSRKDLGRKIGDLQLTGRCIEERCRFGICDRGSAHNEAVTGELPPDLPTRRRPGGGKFCLDTALCRVCETKWGAELV